MEWPEAPRSGAAGGSLVGMSLLYGNRVVLDVVEGGEVLIEPLPRTH